MSTNSKLTSAAPTDVAQREALIPPFLASVGWAGAEVSMLADDASFRRYLRVAGPQGRAVLMDAPPEREATEPFLRIARFLTGKGFSAPKILGEDQKAGFLLLEDLGDSTFTRLMAAGANEDALYCLAIDTLIALHQAVPDGPELRGLVPPYDAAQYLTEVSLLTDWYWPAVKGEPCPAAVRGDFLDLWKDALGPFDAADMAGCAVPVSLVLRDYHVDNVMQLSGREGLAACGLLDFQDALAGSTLYDLVSLLEDARRDVPADLAERMKARYRDAFPTFDPVTFDAAYALLGVQRSVKILGIFARLDRRDGKPSYLKHMPRVWRLVEAGLKHPALAEIKTWFDANWPVEERIRPEALSE